MTHLGLFEGIGGFSLAARWMGWETLAWCEWNEFGQKVLRHHFPEAEGFGDITKTDFTKYANRIDILTGGFPCQPYSAAGKRLGKEDDRHLWPEMLRVIREVQPSWVVGENVLGLVNWSGGLVFHEVQADLEAEGYEVFPFVLPACAVNAPHRRDRVWFVAHSKSNGTRKHIGGIWSIGDGCGKGLQDESFVAHSKAHGFSQSETINERKEHLENNGDGIRATLDSDGCIGNVADTKSKGTWEQSSKNRGREDRRFDNDGKVWDAADTNDERLEGECRSIGELEGGFGFTGANTRNMQRPSWDNFPTQPPIRSGNDGLSARLDSITFPKWRNESIKAAGNAIVPQVALMIFKAIQESIGK